MKMICHDRSDWVPSMTKTRQDNNMTDRTGAVYVENGNELSWPIKSGANYDENQIWKLRYWSYRCNLCRKRNWFVLIGRTVFNLW